MPPLVKCAGADQFLEFKCFFVVANLILSESNLCPFVLVWPRVEMGNSYFSSLIMAIISFMIAIFPSTFGI